LLEFAKPRVHREKDLKGVVPARVLVAIPHLTTPKEDRFAYFFRCLEIGAAVALCILIAIGNLYAFHKG